MPNGVSPYNLRTLSGSRPKSNSLRSDALHAKRRLERINACSQFALTRVLFAMQRIQLGHQFQLLALLMRRNVSLSLQVVELKLA